MKKMIKFFATAAIAALALVSCNKEIEVSVVPAEGIQIAVVADNALDGTKTALSGTKSMVWTAGDKVGFVNVVAGEKVESSAAVIDGDGKATFTATVENAGSFFAFYPSSAWSNYDLAGGAVLRIKNAQEPTNATTFDPRADVLVSEAFDVAAAGASDTPAAIRFKRLGAFIKVYFVDNTTGSKLTGEYATTVSIQSDGAGAQSLATKLTFDENGIISAVGAEKKITATYGADVFAISNASQAAFFGVGPVTLPSGSDLIIKAETTKYSISKTVSLPADVTLGSGDMLPIRVTLGDANLTPKLQIEKVWEMMSTSSVSWTTTLSDGVHSGNAGTDFNIAVDGNYVYVPEFGNSKQIWAISVSDKSDVKLVNNSTIASSGFDGTVYLSCARVVKKSDGTPVLIATNTFSDDNGKLYIWDSGIDNAPRVVTLNQWEAGRRLGDKFTTYGNYEDCWLIFGTQTGNGFVTFKVPTSGTSATLISRLAIDLTNFATYYPFPGDLTNGMFAWHGGTHDDGALYRNRKMTVSSTESAIKTAGAHTSELSKLSTFMASNENNNGTGFNYITFNGKRYVIWCMNSTDSKCFDLIIKSGTTETAWDTIINTTGTVKRDAFAGEMATSWKCSADCAVWNDGTDVYIAINKQNVGIALYHMYMPA